MNNTLKKLVIYIDLHCNMPIFMISLKIQQSVYCTGVAVVLLSR